MIGIVDYGVGNLMSIRNMLHKCGYNSAIVSKSEELPGCAKLILPGVGHFDYAMRNLRASDLIKPLEVHALIENKPILGICLGAQIMGSCSEEGSEKGLSWLNFECCRFPESSKHKVPNMGWNTVEVIKQTPLLVNLEKDNRFYFVHSYYMKCAERSLQAGLSRHGIEYTSIISKSNIHGVQFHPEKSHKYGMSLLKSFAAL